MSKRKKKASSVMPLCLSGGLFLGFGLGVIMEQPLLVTLLALIASAVLAWRIDKKAGVAYTRR
ncbi:MAG: hypothetical protein RQ757_09255 [Pseudomonadales bacterium]|nr:hypothetical protein [Pseudomonadales bacterium]